MANSEKKISKAVIRRLPIYLMYLEELENKNVKGISSKKLGEMTGFTPSQIRQDLNNFGGFGQQGYGYSVNSLKNEIGSILGYGKNKRGIIIGGGKLGKALASYERFKYVGLEVVDIFDRNPDNIGTEIGGITIRDVSELEEYVKNNKVDVGILTIPKESAQEYTDLLVENGARGIWNFASTEVKVPEGVVVENVRLNDSLSVLMYYLDN